MDESTLISIIKSHRENSLGSDTGTLSTDRAKAMDRYHGRPYGNEIEGRSSVVSKDLAEAVDWLISNILNVFLKTGNIAEFLPVGEEDEDAADQETSYVNQVIMQDNNGYLILHDLLKDCFILKNCYVKHWWTEEKKIEEVEYEGQNILQLAMINQDVENEGGNIEVLGKEFKTVNVPTQTPEGIQEVPVEVFDVKFRINRKIQKLRLEAVPPEEIRVHKHAKGSIQDSPYTEHFTTKTRSDLIEMGMDKDFINDLPKSGLEITTQIQARSQTSEEMENSTSLDSSMDELEYSESYLKVDFDDDGIAELRKVITVGGKIPPGDEWNEIISAVPITGGVVKRMPHRHIGESLNDELEDLAEIKTVLQRQMLDNVYATSNQQVAINDRCDVEDFQTSLPGGIKRIEGDAPVTGSFEPLITPPILNQILPVIEYVDQVKGQRTGLNSLNTQIDPDVLKETTEGAFTQGVANANAKLEQYTRMFGETVVKEMVLQVHAILRKHQDIPRVAKQHGKFVTINPQEWRERTDLRLRVGLGTGTEDEKRQKLAFLAFQQEKLMQMGLVLPKHAYALFKEQAETAGYDNPERFALSPDSDEFKQMMQNKPEEKNMLAEAEKVKADAAIAIEQMKAKLKGEIESANLQQKEQFEAQKHQIDIVQKEADRKSNEAIETMKAEVDLMKEGFRVDLGKPGIAADVQGT